MPSLISRATRVRPWKVVLALRLWGLLVLVELAQRLLPLPRLVDRLVRPPGRRPGKRFDPRELSRINDRVLRIGRWRPDCLARSLVHLRCLRAQGDPAELVIGLARKPTTDAHAWVELRGAAVGPAPGRAGHEELIRYPRTTVGPSFPRPAGNSPAAPGPRERPPGPRPNPQRTKGAPDARVADPQV